MRNRDVRVYKATQIAMLQTEWCCLREALIEAEQEGRWLGEAAPKH